MDSGNIDFCLNREKQPLMISNTLPQFDGRIKLSLRWKYKFDSAFHKCFVQYCKTIFSPPRGQICKFNDAGKVCPIRLLYRLHGDPVKHRHRDLETQRGQEATSMQVTIQAHLYGSAPDNIMPGKNCFAFLKGQRQRWVAMHKPLFLYLGNKNAKKLLGSFDCCQNLMKTPVKGVINYYPAIFSSVSA